MSLVLRSIRLDVLRLVVVVSFSGLFGSFTATAQSSRAPAARRAHIVPAAKASARARAVNTEELLSLLKGNDGQPLLVNYWATWCVPCRDEFPDLVKIDKQYRPKGLDFIAITLDDLKDINTKVPRFLRKMRATMPVYLLSVVDPQPAINAVDRNWSGALPATFLYNAKGEIVYKRLGRVNAAELRAAIEKAVGTKQ
jgi:thiol-disulfide isomerase/thioredoxin